MIKFSSNPILFKIGYVNGEQFETVTSASGVLGSAFHHAMEVYSGGTDIPVGNEAEGIELGLKAGMEYLENYNDGFINWTEAIPNKQKLFERFTFLFQEYVKQIPWDNGAVAIEAELKHSVNVEWRGERLVLPVPLKGRIDKVFREDKKLKLKDYKTCSQYSRTDKIDGAKMLQAVSYYLLAYAEYGEAPYSMIFEEAKYTKNSDGSPQVRQYEMVFAENDLWFDFFFRFYEDMTRGLNGEMVYVPNVHTLFDNEISIIAYIHRLDVTEEAARLMKKHQVSTVTDLLKKQIQSAGHMRQFMKAVEKQMVEAKNINYQTMKNEDRIKTKLMEHGVVLQFDRLVEGASVDLYQYMPSIGVKMSKIESFGADVEQVLGVAGVRILAPIPNTSLVGFEVPRKTRTFPALPKAKGFDLAIGQTIMGKDRRFDIRMAPHLLIAGATGSGKSVFLGNLVKQLAAIKSVKLHLFDPKMVELIEFASLPSVIEYETGPLEILQSLRGLITIMNGRYKLMQESRAKSIEGMKGWDYRFVVIDEFGDLFQHREIQDAVLILAQKGRAAGIHLIIATQRPSVDIVSGTIKANFPVKVAFKTAKSTDSVVILDELGAEKLLGRGDMLFYGEEGIERLQGYRA